MQHADELAFYDRIRELGGCLVRLRSKTSIPVFVERLDPVESGFFPPELCIVHREDVARIRTWEVSGLGEYHVDEDNSPVIQFHRSRIQGFTLFRGRIWAQMYSCLWAPELNDEVFEAKGERFERFYNSIARWLRRNYRRDPRYGFYCGPAAWEWFMKDGQLSQF